MGSLVINRGLIHVAEDIEGVNKFITKILMGSIIATSDKTYELQLPNGDYIKQENMRVTRSVVHEGAYTVVSLVGGNGGITCRPKINGNQNKLIVAPDKGYKLLVELNKYFTNEGMHYAVKKNTTGFVLLNNLTGEGIRIGDIVDTTVTDLLMLVFMVANYDTSTLLFIVDESNAHRFEFALNFFATHLKTPIISSTNLI